MSPAADTRDYERWSCKQICPVEAHGELIGIPSAAALGLTGEPRSSKATRLLLVEDNPDDAALRTAMLRSTALSELFEIVLVGRPE